MRRLGPLAACALVSFGAAAFPLVVRAEEPDAGDALESIDDPKLERRLGTRVELPTGEQNAEVAAALFASSGPEAAPQSSDVVIEETAAAPPAAAGRVRNVPRLKLAYRRFVFAQVGPTAKSGAGVDEVFHVLSVDLYPVSSNWRFGVSGQYGWEDGTFRNEGDAIVAAVLSLGGQIPGEVFTPFFEGYAGGGLMQRTHAALNTIATAYGELGLDVGSEIFLARNACLSFALGYIHGVNGFVKQQVFGSFSVDTWSLKIGFGI